MPMMQCSIVNCPDQPIFEDEETSNKLCARHMPDPGTRTWAEMKSEGIEIETMEEYRDEVRGFHDN